MRWRRRRSSWADPRHEAEEGRAIGAEGLAEQTLPASSSKRGTDGSGLVAGDEDGVECAVCHQLTNPDGSEHAGVQTAPYVANSGGTAPDGYYGSGMMVLAGDNTRYGPYAVTAASHSYAGSLFHRDPKVCGTCHDVSNPVTGDLAHNNGAQVPLPPGSFSGVPNSPVAGKAAFLNPPYRFGVTERTFSEHQASGLASLRVRDYGTLPPELRRGVLAKAHEQALLAGRQGDYADGAPRYYSCQSCHMMPVVGKGARQNGAPVRADLPTHDLTGGSTWAPELVKWSDQNNRLRLGAGLDAAQIAALDAGALRARAMLRKAAALDVEGDEVHVVNLTGHKLISGYPEGSRMWLRVTWRDRIDGLILVPGLPAAGATASVTIPSGLLGVVLRSQGIVVSTLALNATYAASPAHDFIFR